MTKSHSYPLDKYQSKWRFVLRYCLQTILLVPLLWLNFRILVKGSKRFATLAGHNFIMVANHNSHLDTLSVIGSLPRRLAVRVAVGAAADYFFQSRLQSLPTRALLNTFPIGRKGDKTYSGISAKLVERGISIMLFPEGTRSRDGQVGQFHTGVFRLAIDQQVLIVPVAISHTAAAWPYNKKLWRWGRPRVTVNFLPPVQPDGTPAELAERVRQLIIDNIEQSNE